MIKFREWFIWWCPKCGKEMRVRDQRPGKFSKKCAKCGTKVEVHIMRREVVKAECFLKSVKEL